MCPAERPAGGRRRIALCGAVLVAVGIAAALISNRVVPQPAAASSLVKLPGSAPSVRGTDGPPDVILVTLDTTRADRLGCYGSTVETPTVDSLAASGTRFARALASAPITAPSHASIFTGLDPHRHGVRENGTYVLDGSQHTLAEILRAEGWTTGGFVGGFPLSARFGLDQGFDHYDDAFAEDNAGPARDAPWQGHRMPYLDRPAASVARRALHWIHRNADRPFFVWLHLFDAHQPYRPPEPFASRYAARPYDGEIAYMDAVLGELFAALSDWGVASNALVVIAADHGESLGEHGLTGHGRRLYEPSVRVPLIIAYPGVVPAARSVERSVRNIDILPTVLELLGLRSPPDLDGESLVPLLAGPASADARDDRPDAYAETLLARLRFGGPERYSLHRWPWKLVREVDADGRTTERLHHLVEDPRELVDRAARDAGVRRELSVALDGRLARGGGEVVPAALDSESEAALRALGYVER